jgi:hypothetical protein
MGDVIHMHEPRDLLLDDARTKNIVFLKLQNTLVLLVRLYDAGSSKRRDGSSRRKKQQESHTVAKFGGGDFSKKERKEERKKD